VSAQLFADALESWQSGNHSRAATLCDATIERNPAHADAYRLLAEIEIARGRSSEAIAACRRVAELAPRDAANLRRLAVLMSQRRKPDAAISLLERSLEIEPDSARALNNLGNLLIEVGRPGEALPYLQRALSLQPDYPSALNNCANALACLNRFDEAIELYGRALALNARFFEAQMNLARTLETAKRVSAALTAFSRAVELDPAHAPAHAGRARALTAMGEDMEAIAAHRQSLQLNPQDPTGFVQMGQLMLARGFFTTAHSAFSAALELLPGSLAAEAGRVKALLALNRHEAAIPAIAALRRLAPDNDYLQGHQLHAQLQCADWRDYGQETTNITERVRRGEKADLPLSFIAHNESPADHYACAAIFTSDRLPAGITSVRRSTRAHPATLRIAYLSPDFRDHPVAQLMTGVVEAHDESRVETYAFSAGPDDGSETRLRIKLAFDHFEEVATLSDSSLAERMADLSIDIAVDLAGHTMGSRTMALALRPAPVQVAYLGFPGTLGADFIDYIIADRQVIPESAEQYYAEKVIYLPGSYLPGVLAPAGGQLPTRAAVGLPTAGFVYCCFNAHHKISPPVFDVWMRILTAVPDSIAWLRDGPAVVKNNLAREAERRGVDPARLVYAPKLATLSDHCARLGLADLFLDTSPYNAHTTASDALAAGVPLLSLCGKTFAGRVATSLLYSCGLEQLSVETAAEYERLAIELALNPQRLAEIKLRLLQMRETGPLFDTQRHCRHLETAYEAIWARYQRGESPSGLSIRNYPATNEPYRWSARQ
jgi:predicted O-linked N-acetylglucosamine transferase (SPINDLY family)